MKVLTERFLRSEIKDEDIDEYVVSEDTIVTPAARQYFNDRRIDLVYGKPQTEDKQEDDSKKQSEEEEKLSEEQQPTYKYESYLNGSKFIDKPEHYTHIYGNQLVIKTHAVIKFRGKLDKLEAFITQGQKKAEVSNKMEIVEELQEILEFVREIMQADVRNIDFEVQQILGMDQEEIREKSHNPRKFFDIKHVTPHWEMDEVVIYLNLIRTIVRETEIQAVEAFVNDDGKVERKDIIQALNRLSSAIYVMMCKYQAGQYN